jgi:mono/diheme cytochrome c family protein
MKKINIGIFFAAALFLSSCSNDRSPNSSHYDPEDPGAVYEFEGDMYYSVPYDPLTQWEHHFIPFNKDSINERMPAMGTIARGKLDYYYWMPNTPEGYERAAKEVINPMIANEPTLAEGKRLYELYCWHCHGKEGNGDGPVIAIGGFPPPQWKSYNSDYIRKLSEGQMYHTVTYGKNAMGSHASQLAPMQRWKIITYIKNVLAVQGTPAGGTATAADSTKTVTSADTTKTAKADKGAVANASKKSATKSKSGK